MEQYPEFLAFKAKSNVKSTTTEPDTTGPIGERTPREVMEDAYATIRTQLAGELLERIAQSSLNSLSGWSCNKVESSKL